MNNIYNNIEGISLPAPAHYYPFRSGRYDVNANLKRLGFDFNNGNTDRNVFQIDHQWPQFRLEKENARTERSEKYICFDLFNSSLERAVNAWFLQQLSKEHEEYFESNANQDGEMILNCRLSGENLHFDKNYTLVNNGVYINGFDALAMQVQEDIAVVKLLPNGEDRLVAIHLCFPNHWAAENKIGQSFLDAHKPVAGFDQLAKHTKPLLKNMTKAGSFVRFAWGIATDTRLNHHPQAPEQHPDGSHWHGRTFDSTQPEAYVRIERQVLTGLPEQDAFIFTIRTYFLEIKQLSKDDRYLLAQAINSMSEATLRYKGLADYHTNLTEWLRK